MGLLTTQPASTPLNPLGTNFPTNNLQTNTSTPNTQQGSNLFSPTTLASGVYNTFANGTPSAFFQPNQPISANNIPSNAPKVDSTAIKPSSVGPLTNLGLVSTPSSGSAQPVAGSNTSFTVDGKTYTDNPGGNGQTVSTGGTADTSGQTVGGTSNTGPFNVSIPTTIPSSALSSGNSYQDVLNQRTQYEQTYQQALNDYANTVTQNNQNAFTTEHAGDTTQFGQAGLSLANEQAAITNQNALLKTQNAGTMLGINQQDIQNALARVPNLQSTQVSPTGDLYAISRDPTTGAVSAQSIGNIYGNGQGGSGGSSAGGAGNSSGSVQALDGSTISGAYAQAAQSLPATIQPYVFGGPQGVAYVNADRVPDSQKQYAQISAANAGIPYLTGTQVQAIQSIDTTFQSLTGMQSLVNQTLGSGIGGSVEGLTTNPLQQFFGVGKGPLLTQFNSYRESAINAVKAVAGGSSGLRINGAELDAAASNLPTPQDNAETANAKIAKFQELLNAQLGEIFPNVKQTQNQTSGTGSNYSGTVVQTKVGAIPTDW